MAGIRFFKEKNYKLDGVWERLGFLQGAKNPYELSTWFDEVAKYILKTNEERLIIYGYDLRNSIFPIVRRVHQGILGKTKEKINLVNVEEFFTFVSEWIAEHIDYYKNMAEKVEFDWEATMVAKLSDEIIDIIINVNEEVDTEEETEEEQIDTEDDGTEGLDT